MSQIIIHVFTWHNLNPQALLGLVLPSCNSGARRGWDLPCHTLHMISMDSDPWTSIHGSPEPCAYIYICIYIYICEAVLETVQKKLIAPIYRSGTGKVSNNHILMIQFLGTLIQARVYLHMQIPQNESCLIISTSCFIRENRCDVCYICFFSVLPRPALVTIFAPAKSRKKLDSARLK